MLKKRKILLYSILFILFIFGTALSFRRFYHFEVFYYDFGIFSRIVWLLSRFQNPIIDHYSLGKIHFLGDHFSPSLILLAPLFWLSPDLKIMLLEQALVTVLSSFIIFKIADKLKLSFISSLSIMLAFFFFAGTLNPLVTEWHIEPTAGLLLLLFLYLFLFTKKRFWYWIIALIFLGFKESNGIYLFFTAIFLFFAHKKKRLEAVTFGLIGIFWTFITTRFIIPFISQQSYLYKPDTRLSIAGAISNSVKRQLLFESLVAFGFLPFFAGFAAFPLLFEFILRLLPEKPIFGDLTLTFHYNVFLGIFLGLATIYAFKRLSRVFSQIKYIEIILSIFLLIFSLFTARKIAISPINLAISPIFWKEIQPDKRKFDFLEKVPKVGSVMSQNNILPYLVRRRDDVYFLKDDYKVLDPDSIVFDMTPGQSPNNFWQSDKLDLGVFKQRLEKDMEYMQISSDDPYLVLFVKK